jgi:hypothetical protein
MCIQKKEIYAEKGKLRRQRSLLTSPVETVPRAPAPEGPIFGGELMPEVARLANW